MLVICFVEVLVLLMIAFFLWNLLPNYGEFGTNKSVQVGQMSRGYFDKRLSAFSNRQQLGSFIKGTLIADPIKSSYNQTPSHA